MPSREDDAHRSADSGRLLIISPRSLGFAVADPLDACRMLWKLISAMMAPVIGTDADVDGFDQAAYLRYLLFMSVVTVARRLQSGPPGRLLAIHAHRSGRHHRCGDRARLMPSLMSDLDGNRLAQGLSNG